MRALGKGRDMGKFKRGLTALFAAVCAVALSLGAATNAYAANYSKDVTFEGLGAGDRIDAYKLISYTDDYSGYKVDDKFKEFLESSNNPEYAQLPSNPSEDDLTEWFSGLDASRVNQILISYANNWGNNAPNATDTAGSNGGSANLSFDVGYYMVLGKTTANSTGARLYNPVSVFVRVNGETSTVKVGDRESAGDISVQIKSQDAPTLEKYLVRANNSLHKTRTVSPGETVQFAIKVQFGALAGGVNPSPVIHDALTNLTLDPDSFEVHEVGANDTIGDATIADATTYTDKGDGKFELALDWTKISGRSGVEGEASSKAVYVTYTATVADGIVASKDSQGRYAGANEAYLTYRTSAQQDGVSKTNTSSTSVYTFALDLEKLDMDRNDLSGAKFELYDGDSSQPVRFKRVDDYYVVDPSGSVTELEASDGDGHNELKIRGIDCSRNYELKETVAPKGYYVPASRWVLSFESLKQQGNVEEHTGNLGGATVAAEDASDTSVAGLVNITYEDATAKLNVKNSNLPSLPTTGGMGTVLFTVAGVALMAIAAAVYFFARRRNN